MIEILCIIVVALIFIICYVVFFTVDHVRQLTARLEEAEENIRTMDRFCHTLQEMWEQQEVHLKRAAGVPTGDMWSADGEDD